MVIKSAAKHRMLANSNNKKKSVYILLCDFCDESKTLLSVVRFSFFIVFFIYQLLLLCVRVFFFCCVVCRHFGHIVCIWKTINQTIGIYLYENIPNTQIHVDGLLSKKLSNNSNVCRVKFLLNFFGFTTIKQYVFVWRNRIVSMEIAKYGE